MLFNIGSLFNTTKGGLGLIKNITRTANDNMKIMITKAKVIPFSPYKSPPIAGPDTAAICQELLCQLVALGSSSLGTNMLTNAKEVGPLKALAIPVRKAIV